MEVTITLPLALLAGLVSFASPCFLPIVPAFVSQLVGGGHQEVSRRGALASAVCFVVGFSAVFIALWASVGLIGRSLGPYAVYARVTGGAVLVLMGLHVARLLTIRPFDTQVRAYGPSGAGPASPLRAGVIGVVFAAGWTPCIGPILSGILALATVSATAWSGIGLMVAYCLGLGAPVVAVALGSAQVTRRFDWFRRHHVAVSLASGAVLVAVGLLMVTGLLGRLSALAPGLSL
ncbi:cytochrome c biogenesis protein CcdA [Actinomyces sp. 2119]|uniref:Cytochrome c biogenesis protein CcdA n=1 Tax=Actinomyces lilanjuaniae TaxID=2321394 RepID=A0ABN5PQC4_9ACTO|nr:MULTISPECIES: cytochrome c biogenesis protein CcdA [Actinomyces]AYD90595.1 cytochrome c biogenesis protein CcdA [Actinomyces lilanjuaniae]RJF43949.1 cytochrome c biogenesis protein CcdA [Actinomyces sp. 2119]